MSGDESRSGRGTGTGTATRTGTGTAAGGGFGADETVLQAERVSVYAPSGAALVSEVSCGFLPGTLSVVIGPNGAGKTSLIRALAGLAPGLAPGQMTGTVRLAGDDITALATAERARRLSYLPQSQSLSWPQPVRDIVALGRFAYGARPAKLATEDRRAVDQALADCNLTALAARAADTLSGGESARMHIARALAAETPVILADEPIAALDPRAGHEAMQLFRRAAMHGAAVVVVVHDLHLAARYADRILWLKGGTLVADGPPGETMTSARLGEVFGIAAALTTDGAGRIVLAIEGPDGPA